MCCVYDEQNSKGQNSRDWKLFSALQWLRGVIRQFCLSEVGERQRGTRHGIDVGHKSRPSTSSECGEGAWRCPSQDLRRFHGISSTIGMPLKNPRVAPCGNRERLLAAADVISRFKYHHHPDPITNMTCIY